MGEGTRCASGADDEIVVLSRHAGPEATDGAPDPAGVAFAIGKEMFLVAPDGGDAGYVYFYFAVVGGMTFGSSSLSGTIVVDGMPDAVRTGLAAWE